MVELLPRNSIVLYRSGNRYHNQHAEINALLKLPKFKKTKTIEMTVFRITSNKQLFTMACPCYNCMKSIPIICKKKNIKLKSNKIKYTDWNGNIECIYISI